ncbi:MAG TPA: hypothetical protein VGW10_13840 [Solirubrobacteraceae bacterium]|nr:hypothetical protein [Solirubrobacteraceae bacterium]
MIPLHLSSTTVHVSPEQAELLVSARVAEWLPLGVRALRSIARADSDVLDRLGYLRAAA